MKKNMTMEIKNKSPYIYLFFALTLIILDQGIKLWMFFEVVPNHFGEIDLIPSIFKLHYIENRGMAFGMELGGEYGKLFLTVFRLCAMGGIIWYLLRLVKKNVHSGFLWSVSAILGGAIGNLIDSIFYGVYLKNAPIGVPSPWFHGQVIDMFYAYGLEGLRWPAWFPLNGGEYLQIPIFNFADACIFVGVVSILVFQNTFFGIDNQESSDTAILNPIEQPVGVEDSLHNLPEIDN